MSRGTAPPKARSWGRPVHEGCGSEIYVDCLDKAQGSFKCQLCGEVFTVEGWFNE